MTLTLNLTERQAALLAHAIVEFQDTMHRQSHEDFSIDEETIADIQEVVNQILTQTEVEVYVDVADHAFSA